MPTSPEPAAEFCVVAKPEGGRRNAQILQSNNTHSFVRYLDGDKRTEEWVQEENIIAKGSTPLPPTTKRKRKRKNAPNLPSDASQAGESSSSVSNSTPAPANVFDPKTDLSHMEHIKNNAKAKNFDFVFFGEWKIKTWYFSPYPLADTEMEDPSSSALARPHKPPNRTTRKNAEPSQDAEPTYLCVCERCFKYFSNFDVWEAHQTICSMHPPGRKVYVRDPYAIWEIDGAVAKLFCQNLSLFAKLFIDIKTLFFDLDNFMFYVLTRCTHSREFVIGYFSKEKISYDDYNLACIVTFPHCQRSGFGRLMIEFSYELSRRAGKVGTPERPLSVLGLRGYLSYWVSTIVLFFKHVLRALPPRNDGIIVTKNNFPDVTKLKQASIKKKRRAVDDMLEEGTNLNVRSALEYLDDPIFTTERRFETELRKDGVAETHVHICCTIEDIARATNLRVDDAAFALNECGLMMKRFSEDSEVEPGAFIITRPMVDELAKRRKIVGSLLDLDCVML